MSLSHEDCQGAFIIDEYDKDNVEWVKSALDGFEIRDRKNKDIEINIDPNGDQKENFYCYSVVIPSFSNNA